MRNVIVIVQQIKKKNKFGTNHISCSIVSTLRILIVGDW